MSKKGNCWDVELKKDGAVQKVSITDFLAPLFHFLFKKVHKKIAQSC
ncbi:hypothetical protein JOD45_003161, partial [Scopulibacillus daqui]|nr:hypothetical protein [Scopulibacillus daqui]